MDGLLSHAAQLCDLDLLQHRLDEIKDECRVWWEHTTNRDYLESILSRRGMRSFVWPVFWANNLYLDSLLFRAGNDDFYSQDMLRYVLTLDVVVLLLACVAAFTPARNLWPDALYSTAVVLYAVITYQLSPQTAGFSNILIVVNLSSGLHPIANFVCALASGLSSTTACPSTWFTLAVAIAAGSICGVNDAKCAARFADMQRQCYAVDHLLEGAGDGSCVVCTDDGKIVNATSKLAENLGTADLVGSVFTDFVSTLDERRVEEVYDKAFARRALDTALVTFLTDVCEFDAKLIPYATSGKLVSLCIQVQGERRFHEGIRMRVPRVADIDDVGDRLSHRSGFRGGAGSVTSLAYTQTSQATGSSIEDQARDGVAARQIIPSTAPGSSRHSTASVSLRHPKATVSQEFACAAVQRHSHGELGSGHGAPRTESRPNEPGRSSPRAEIDTAGDAVAPAFQIGSAAGIHEGITWLIRHWKIAVPSVGVCCELHACLEQISRTALELRRMRPCDASWTRLPPWTCQFCATQNQHRAARCYVCYLKRPGSTSEAMRQTLGPSNDPRSLYHRL